MRQIVQTVEARKTNREVYKEFVQKKLPWLLILLWLTTKIIGHYIPYLYYTPKSQQSSPSGKYTILAFSSVSESGHAPYGDYLVISKTGKVSNPGNEMIVFAGYCKNSPEYSWISNTKIEVVCENKEPNPIQTLVQKVYGITIEVKLMPHNNLL